MDNVSFPEFGDIFQSFRRDIHAFLKLYRELPPEDRSLFEGIANTIYNFGKEIYAYEDLIFPWIESNIPSAKAIMDIDIVETKSAKKK